MYFQENQVVVESFVIPIWGIVLGAIGIYFLISCVVGRFLSIFFQDHNQKEEPFIFGIFGLFWPFTTILVTLFLLTTLIGKIATYRH